MELGGALFIFTRLFFSCSQAEIGPPEGTRMELGGALQRLASADENLATSRFHALLSWFNARERERETERLMDGWIGTMHYYLYIVHLSIHPTLSLSLVLCICTYIRV